MPTYAIGDLQGCLTPLKKLLDIIHFDPTQDTLWFAGDLVNRGPESLATLQFVKSLGSKHRIVLGNHDLHLLARSYAAHPGWPEDTFDEILAAPDRTELINWLSQQPLAIHDPETNYLMVHAGVAKDWDANTLMQLSAEVQAVIQSDRANEFFTRMYGNFPDQWSPQLIGWERLRCITNYLTRVRFCHADGRIELSNKGTLAKKPDHLQPWFQIQNRQTQDIQIIFGHWAALGGITHTPNTFALDTGCIWGYSLTAMRLCDQRRFSVPCDKIGV